jgi:hypothetical protein
MAHAHSRREPHRHLARWVVGLSAVALLVAGCGSGKHEPFDVPNERLAETFTDDNWSELAADPEAKRGASVDVAEKVWSSDVTDEGAVVHMLIGEKKDVLLVLLRDTAAPPAGSYLRINGTVTGAVEGTNGYGQPITATAAVASSRESVDKITALAPTVDTWPARKAATQRGIRIGIQRIEIARDETRVYVNIENENRSGDTFWFEDFMQKLIDDGRKLRPTYDSHKYGGVEAELAPGASVAGIIVFPPIDGDGKVRVLLNVFRLTDSGNETLTWEWSYP